MSGTAPATPAGNEWVRRVLGLALPPEAPGNGNNGADAAALRAAIAAWRRASDAVDGQIGAMQSFLRRSDDEELREIGEFGLNALTGNHRVRLTAAMMEAERGNAGIHARLADLVAGFRDHIADSDEIEACDENPFGVAVSIRATLGPALDRLERALAGT